MYIYTDNYTHTYIIYICTITSPYFFEALEPPSCSILTCSSCVRSWANSMASS